MQKERNIPRLWNLQWDKINMGKFPAKKRLIKRKWKSMCIVWEAMECAEVMLLYTMVLKKIYNNLKNKEETNKIFYALY